MLDAKIQKSCLICNSRCIDYARATLSRRGRNKTVRRILRPFFAVISMGWGSSTVPITSCGSMLRLRSCGIRTIGDSYGKTVVTMESLPPSVLICRLAEFSLFEVEVL